MANWLVDGFFWMDIVLQFMIAYRDPVTGYYVTVHSKIARHYIHSWFLIDVAATFPLHAIVGEDRFRIFRFLRLLRLVKLLRLLKASDLVRRWNERVHISFLARWLLHFFCVLLLASHWMACLLGIAGSMNVERRWSDAFAEDYYPGQLALTFWEEYLGALYFAVMTLTSIGYGDVLPQSTGERAVVVVIMLFGGCACGSRN